MERMNTELWEMGKEGVELGTSQHEGFVNNKRCRETCEGIQDNGKKEHLVPEPRIDMVNLKGSTGAVEKLAFQMSLAW